MRIVISHRRILISRRPVSMLQHRRRLLSVPRSNSAHPSPPSQRLAPPGPWGTAGPAGEGGRAGESGWKGEGERVEEGGRAGEGGWKEGEGAVGGVQGTGLVSCLGGCVGGVLGVRALCFLMNISVLSTCTSPPPPRRALHRSSRARRRKRCKEREPARERRMSRAERRSARCKRHAPSAPAPPGQGRGGHVGLVALADGLVHAALDLRAVQALHRQPLRQDPVRRRHVHRVLRPRPRRPDLLDHQVVQVRLQRRLRPPPRTSPSPSAACSAGPGLQGAVRPGLLGRWPRCRRGGSWIRRTTPPAANWTAAGPSPRAATESRAPPDPHSRPQPSAETRGGPNARDLCMPSAAQLQMH